MNYLHVVKTLDLLEQAPTFFNLEEKTYLAGLTATELKDVKKYIIKNELVQACGKNLKVTEEGKKFCKRHSFIPQNIDKYTNLEFLKIIKTTPNVSKAINNLAKHLLNGNDIKIWSVEYNILRELKSNNVYLDKLRSEVEDFFLNNDKILVSQYFKKYTSVPYSLTKSLATTLLLEFISKHKNNIVIYKETEIQLKINNILFINICGSPERYYIKNVINKDNPLIEEISKLILDTPTTNILSVVKGLISFIKTLNRRTLQTNKLTKQTIKFRNAILNAEDPVLLLCKELPQILCGKEIDYCSHDLVKLFENSLNELRNSYQLFLNELTNFLLKSFNASSREELSERFLNLQDYLGSKELNILFTNITERFSPTQLWMERICISQNGSLAPEDWNDNDTASFKLRIKDNANIFLKIEEIVFDLSQFNENSSKLHQNIIDLLSQFSKREQIELFKKVINS